MTPLTKDGDGLKIRLPKGMRAELKEIAARNRRSMNAEVVCFIERGIAETKTASNHQA